MTEQVEIKIPDGTDMRIMMLKHLIRSVREFTDSLEEDMKDFEEDSVRPLPGAGPEIASMVKAINENPMNAMCDKEGQTVPPLKESDGLWHPSKDWKPKDSAPAEPAPGSDAEHPPVGYRLEPRGGERRKGYLWWYPDRREWIPCTACIGLTVEADAIANPIPANEGDSRLAESVAIPTEPARDLSADRAYWRDTANRHFQGWQKERAKNALLRDQLTKMLEGM